MQHYADQKGIGKRVKSLITERKEAPTLFAGLNNTGRKLNGKVPWTRRDIDKICRHTSVSEEWLTSGEGDKYQPLNKFTEKIGGNEMESFMFTKTLPRLPIKAMSGGIREYYTGNRRHECDEKPVIEQFPTYNFTLLVDKDYMAPYINTGDVIACKEVETVDEEGGVYVIDTDKEAVLKRVYKTEVGLRLVSENKCYPDNVANAESITGIYKVVGLLRVGI